MGVANNDSTGKSDALPKFLSNPWISLITTVCTIIGIPLAVLLYLDAKKERDLYFYVYPLRTTVLQSRYAAGLRVLHNNEEIKTDVTGVQIAVWNNGKEPIFKQDMLEQVKIVTLPAVPILEATIRKQTRQINDISADLTSMHMGVLPLSWKVLEKGDGAIIQLIYAGPADTKIELAGTILGQTQINTAIDSNADVTKPRSMAPTKTGKWIDLITNLILTGMMVFFLIFGRSGLPSLDFHSTGNHLTLVYRRVPAQPTGVCPPA